MIEVTVAPEGNVLDTGPLLCLGGAPVLLRHYRRRWAATTAWVEAVRGELLAHARRSGGVGDAARRYNGTGSRWLPAPAPFGDDDADVKRVLEAVRRLAADKPGGNTRQRGGTADLGEAQSIVHAGRQGMVFLSCDDNAREVSRRCRVLSRTVVDLARDLVAEDRSQAKPLSGEFHVLMRNGIDIGEVVKGPLDLHPPSLARRSNPDDGRQRPPGAARSGR